MTINTPITNSGLYYINGLELAYVSTTTMTVNFGRCRDSTNSNDISVGLPIPVAATQTGVEPVAAGTGAVTINIAANGVAGLDSGTKYMHAF